MSWYAESREQKREDKRADVELEIAKQQAAAEIKRKQARQDAEQARKDRESAERRKKERRDERRARRKAFLGKLAAHAADLLIYPIALLSFVMAAPAMSGYGSEVYALGDTEADANLGVLLPGISELAMWAFAIAVQVTRRRKPDASVARLQMGVWVFGAIAFALNFIHGLGARFDYGVVMGIIAVSGVVAHQLVVAAPPRSRQERREARLASKQARKIAKAREAAIADARVEIDADGRARLMFKPGVYRVGRDRADRLRPAIDPMDRPGARDAMDDAIADLIATETARAEQATDDGETGSGGGVGLLDRPARKPGHETGPETGPDIKKPGKTSRRGGRKARPIEALRADLEALLEATPEAVSWSGSRLARELGCDKRRALALRDELRARRDL